MLFGLQQRAANRDTCIYHGVDLVLGASSGGLVPEYPPGAYTVPYGFLRCRMVLCGVVPCFAVLGPFRFVCRTVHVQSRLRMRRAVHPPLRLATHMRMPALLFYF